MSTNCDNCGYKDNEVKSGSAISELGRKLTLRVEDKEDLSRDVLKSETAGFAIPEIDLHLAPGTLGGRSWDQNEDLGLNDINVDNYSTDPELQQQQQHPQQAQQ
ncbi:hypothetical protein L1887_62082 [Cichorium endivia]|nr:hypothetical protein L1887_62082 [Cichorium endivia]